MMAHPRFPIEIPIAFQNILLFRLSVSGLLLYNSIIICRSNQFNGTILVKKPKRKGRHGLIHTLRSAAFFLRINTGRLSPSEFPSAYIL